MMSVCNDGKQKPCDTSSHCPWTFPAKQTKQTKPPKLAQIAPANSIRANSIRAHSIEVKRIAEGPLRVLKEIVVLW
jgi:hypothetical protein